MVRRLKSLAAVRRRSLDLIRVFRSPLDRRRGLIVAGALVLPCALGSAGPVRDKREGDGGTPLGRHRVLGALYRPDRIRRPRTGLPLTPIRPGDGWCDAPGDRRYNRPVHLPYPASHERMWREDHLYDLVLDLSWNRRPVVRNRGSAIFLHAARPDFSSTEGCVAVDRRAILRLVERIGPRTVIEVVG
jgi:L,D-peptidoglycan transpeptidase YkuD (ErfK/YbiS/YcfS/YnhG family)